MASVWKDILYPGLWHLRDGRTFHCTPKDLQYFNGRMRDMIAAGLPIPLSWEHQPRLKPGSDSSDEARADRAKFCLGDARDVRGETGILETYLEVPKDADREQLKAVRFVSPYIENDFIDSTGKKWDGPSITHIAVTPRPIQHTQRPFAMSQDGAKPRNLTPASVGGNLPTANCYPIALSLQEFEGPMADEKDDADKGEKLPPVDDDAAATDDSEAAPACFTETDVPELVELLAQHKIILGEGVTAANFADRLKASLHTKAAHDGTGDGGMMNPETQATATEVAMSADFISLKARCDRAEGKIVTLEQESLKRRISTLAETQRISKPLRDQLMRDATSVSLSLDPASGEVAGVPLIYKIQAYEALGKGNAFALSHDGATEASPPSDLTTDNRAAQEKAGDEMARMAGASVKAA